MSLGDIVILLSQQRLSIAVGTIAEDKNEDYECYQSDHLPVHIIMQLKSTNGIEKGKTIRWPKVLTAKPIKVMFAPNIKQSLPSPSPISPVSDLPSDTNDRILNYAVQVLQLGVFKMQLGDTEREGDGERMMRNWKMLMLFSRSRTRGGKYAFEAMRLITYCRVLYSEKMAHRIINGQFVNPRGAGNNYENDLKQEHIVKGNKVALQGLCGNKTLKAATRVTKSAYSQKTITDNFDVHSIVSKDSTSHTYGNCKEDVKSMVITLHNLKPFKYTPGRKHDAFPTLSKSRLDQLDPVLLDK